jgi:hypothetical protein
VAVPSEMSPIACGPPQKLRSPSLWPADGSASKADSLLRMACCWTNKKSKDTKDVCQIPPQISTCSVKLSALFISPILQCMWGIPSAWMFATCGCTNCGSSGVSGNLPGLQASKLVGVSNGSGHVRRQVSLVQP